jgi:hypothetical protein
MVIQPRRTLAGIIDYVMVIQPRRMLAGIFNSRPT